MVQISIDEALASLPVIESQTRTGCGSCGSGEGDSRCGNGLEKIYPTTAVRFGYMKHIGEFSYAPNMRFTCGARVVVQTSRGMEIGEQVSLTCTGCSKSVTREQMKSYADASGENTFIFDAGRVLREANRADLAEYAHLQSVVPQHRDLCRRLARQHGMAIKVVECELLFGGERAIFYFSAEGRIDFRDLVKDLSEELQTRIQMVQVGARDEARLLADFETCGRECCCKVFLKTLKPVTMKMAKMQKQTIDPSKVSGRCGRLKCCLRYEHESYEELASKLPRIGARIHTAHGDGVVVNRQILTQLVQIETADERLVTVVVEDILPGEPARLDPGGAPRMSGDAPRMSGGAPRMRGGESQGSERPTRRGEAPSPPRPREISPPAGRVERLGETPPSTEGSQETGPQEILAGEGPRAADEGSRATDEGSRTTDAPRPARESGRGERPRRPTRRRIVGRQVGPSREGAPPREGASPPAPNAEDSQGPKTDAPETGQPPRGEGGVRRFRRRKHRGGPRPGSPPSGGAGGSPPPEGA
ncbi:MAG: hypothetical protein IT449_17445 [Phycisphaerales bacterium]|nr:hypothetical protein [Phycisphaerales bacterium]